MNRIRKLLALLLVLPMLLILPENAEAAGEDTLPYIQRMIQYYLHYQEDAQSEIDSLLDQVAQVNPDQGTLWKTIMADWSWCNTQMPIHPEILPDGLPQDDSLCIVVLGYSLNDNGSLQPELMDRLTVALHSAEKYPNAYIAVTGGGTADDPSITEGKAMAQWLIGCGIPESRIIIEDKSLNTNENAENTYNILLNQYPQVTSLAVVSSDYHLPWGCAMFKTMASYTSSRGGRAIELVANAANATEKTMDTMFSQAWGVSVITHTPFVEGSAPALYYQPETTAPEPLPTPVAQTEAAAEEAETAGYSWYLFPAAMVALAVVIACIPTKKKEKKPRNRRERPKM